LFVSFLELVVVFVKKILLHTYGVFCVIIKFINDTQYYTAAAVAININMLYDVFALKRTLKITKYNICDYND